MWRVLFIGFLFAHAAIHLAIWATPAAKSADAPFDAAVSWLLGEQRMVAMLIAVAAAVALAGAGVGVWAHADWWRPVAVVGLAASFGLMIAWFNPWFSFIEVVNAALLIGIAWLSWPSEAAIGA